MIIAVIQARMASTRLPGKVLKKIEGRSLLRHIINRVKKSNLIDKIIIATTRKENDKKIIAFAKKNKIDFFAGSSEDVLDRFYGAVKDFGDETTIVRITSDDPFKDPGIIDACLRYFLKHKGKLDYLSNTLLPTYPEGLDVEVFTFKALRKAWLEAKLRSEREHVTPYIWKNKRKFRIKNLPYKKDLSNLRWTIDYEKDLGFARKVYKRLYPKKKVFLMKDILKLLEDEPELKEINSGIDRGEGYKKSIKKEKRINGKKKLK